MKSFFKNKKKQSSTSQRIVHVDDFGPVVFKKTSRSKYLRITTRENGSVIVTMPKYVSYAKGEAFLEEKRELIKQHIEEVKKIQNSRVSMPEMSRVEMKQGRDFLFGRLSELAERGGFEFNRVSFRRQKTVWGSCSADNNISLNLNLMHLPDDLRDYVLWHELVHTRIKNHSQRFWRELDKYVGDGKHYQKALRDFSLR